MECVMDKNPELVGKIEIYTSAHFAKKIHARIWRGRTRARDTWTEIQNFCCVARPGHSCGSVGQ